MTASPEQILVTAEPTSTAVASLCGCVERRASAGDAAVIRQAAEERRMSVTQFMLEAALAEARRVLHHDRRLVGINEVFDRLAVALGEAEGSVDALGELIEKARRQTPW